MSLESLLFIKNELSRLGLPPVSVTAEGVNTNDVLNSVELDIVHKVIRYARIELYEDKKEALVAQIKNLIMGVVYRNDTPETNNLSTYLEMHLGYNYCYMSNLFSECEHSTIEKFYLCHRIERVKELLIYKKMSLTDIAAEMRYSSLGHLSSQCRKPGANHALNLVASPASG